VGSCEIEPDCPTMETSLLEELSEQISKKASIISQFLRSNSYPQPSFDRNGPIITLPAGAPQEVRVARQSLIDASLKIFQLAVGPAEFLPNIAVGVCYLPSLALWQTSSSESNIEFSTSIQLVSNGSAISTSST